MSLRQTLEGIIADSMPTPGIYLCNCCDHAGDGLTILDSAKRVSRMPDGTYLPAINGDYRLVKDSE
jgi:hypothetical protein